MASSSYDLGKKNKWESNVEKAASVHAKPQPVWERVWEDQRHWKFAKSLKSREK